MTAPGSAPSRDLLAGGAPWIAYWLGTSLGYPAVGAGLAAFTLLAIRCSDWRAFKLFELAILVYFVGLSVDRCCANAVLAETFRRASLPVLLALAAFGSLAAGHPCTMQYARAMVGPEWWNNRHFIRVNAILTAAWGFIFLAMAALEHIAAAFPVPELIAGGGSLLLLTCGACLTRQYPRWYRMHRYLPLVRAGKEPFLRSPRH